MLTGPPPATIAISIAHVIPGLDLAIRPNRFLGCVARSRITSHSAI